MVRLTLAPNPLAKPDVPEPPTVAPPKFNVISLKSRSVIPSLNARSKLTLEALVPFTVPLAAKGAFLVITTVGRVLSTITVLSPPVKSVLSKGAAIGLPAASVKLKLKSTAPSVSKASTT